MLSLAWPWDLASSPQANCTAKPPEVFLIEYFYALTYRRHDLVCLHTEINAQKAPPGLVGWFYSPSFIVWPRSQWLRIHDSEAVTEEAKCLRNPVALLLQWGG